MSMTKTLLISSSTPATSLQASAKRSKTVKCKDPNSQRNRVPQDPQQTQEELLGNGTAHQQAARKHRNHASD